ncbi:MAG: prepilin-type N-terminal cleavage/methylation domain-containing protein [Oscillospiraceae bacterium]|jgi:prepilin-type N-terminal cleavage/methylation domain-containing protein|nr:prepilin-type N-terminal cleavage/methylation domain-containing protein [Oscillospiraceae bacterium]
MKALPALRKNKKKGFTLVEIIVVLVIIAILMASLAPVVIGWIREAQDTALIAEATSLYTAASTIYVDYVGRGPNNALMAQGSVDPWPHASMSGSNIWNLLGSTAAPGSLATTPAPIGSARAREVGITGQTITLVLYQKTDNGRVAVWSIAAVAAAGPTPALTSGWQVLTEAQAAPLSAGIGGAIT